MVVIVSVVVGELDMISGKPLVDRDGDADAAVLIGASDGGSVGIVVGDDVGKSVRGATDVVVGE